jgi:D-alanyl-D-alanine carboxypeptidase/D-alanyl-D-alanine carboxypeptidase (penicillin-binding protein 5/6)
MYALSIESANDAANGLAEHVAGTTEDFANMMNEKAKECGALNTHFVNPHGLHDEEHYSTAYDMALLGSFAIKNKQFRDICSQSSIRASYGNPEYQRTFKNHNKLLNSVEGAFGIKTGFTKASGRCLVSAAEKNGVTLVAVTLSAPDDWNDHKKLFEYGFEKVKIYEMDFDTEKIELDVVGSDNKKIGVKLKNKLTYTAIDEEMKPETVVLCDKFLYSGVQKGDRVGCVRVFSENGKYLCESDLVSTENAPANFTEKEKEMSFFDKIKDFYKNR